jgi:hypothetical protein
MEAGTVRQSQRLRALARANAVRLARAELKRRIADGEVSVADVVLAAPWEVRSCPVSGLLAAQRGWGAARVQRFLLRSGVSGHRQLGQLTERQRRVLAAELQRRQASPLAVGCQAVGQA